MFIKKGAMFGLDARIALAIFGALSVISGAALYSAIQTAKSESINQGLKEVEKAIEAYMVDMGHMSEYYPTYDIIELGCLATNYSNCDADAAYWKGPYIGEESSPYWLLSHRVTGDADFDTKLEGFRFAGSSWSGTASDVPDACNNSDCYIYIGYSTSYTTSPNLPAVPNMSTLISDLFVRMDAYLDNSDGARTGNVRRSGTAVYFKTAVPDKQS